MWVTDTLEAYPTLRLAKRSVEAVAILLIVVMAFPCHAISQDAPPPPESHRSDGAAEVADEPIASDNSFPPLYNQKAVARSLQVNIWSPRSVIRDREGNKAVRIARTTEALSAALKVCDGSIQVMCGILNLPLPMPKTADASAVAREILDVIDNQMEFGLFRLGEKVIINTPQKDGVHPILGDASRIATAIMSALSVQDRQLANDAQETRPPVHLAT